MYKKTKTDYNHFTKYPSCRNFYTKVKRIKSNPGMKMVLLNRFINETPTFLFFVRWIAKVFYNGMVFKYGIDLPLKLKFGENLRIFHFGGVIINPNVIIGDNCVIMQGVTIGNNFKNDKCPTIQNNVFIGAGAKVIGDIFIVNGTKIGANAVVTKSVLVEGETVVGIPAKALKNSREAL